MNVPLGEMILAGKDEIARMDAAIDALVAELVGRILGVFQGKSVEEVCLRPWPGVSVDASGDRYVWTFSDKLCQGVVCSHWKFHYRRSETAPAWTLQFYGADDHDTPLFFVTQDGRIAGCLHMPPSDVRIVYESLMDHLAIKVVGQFPFLREQLSTYIDLGAKVLGRKIVA